jgi:hypothetical protein
MPNDLLLDPQIRTWVVVPIVVIALCIGLCRQYIIMLIRKNRPASAEALDQMREEYGGAEAATKPFCEPFSASPLHRSLLTRSRALRANGRFLPPQVRCCSPLHGPDLFPQAFRRRKAYFNDEKTGILSRAKEAYSDAPAPNPLAALGGGEGVIFCELFFHSRASTGSQDPSAMTDMFIMQAINMVPMVVIGGIINHVFSGFVLRKDGLAGRIFSAHCPRPGTTQFRCRSHSPWRSSPCCSVASS